MAMIRDQNQYHTRTINTVMHVDDYSDGEHTQKDYYTGHVWLTDPNDGPPRQCCFLRYTCIEVADEQIRCFGQFSHQNLAQSLCMYPFQKENSTESKPDGLVLVAVTKFKYTLLEKAEEKRSFWKYKGNEIFGTQDNFRVFLVTLTKLAYYMSMKDLFVDMAENILSSIAFASADFQNPLLIKLAPPRSTDPSKPMHKLLTSIDTMLNAVLTVQKRAQTPPKRGTAPKQGEQIYLELRHLMSLLTNSKIFVTRDSEEQLLRHPVLTTPKGKKDLICDIWKLWKNNKHLGMHVFRKSKNKVEFETWQTKVKEEHWDYQERLRRQITDHDLVGLVQFARNCFSHVRDECSYLQATAYHSDEDLVDMLLRVSPNLFVELYVHKENLSVDRDRLSLPARQGRSVHMR